MKTKSITLLFTTAFLLIAVLSSCSNKAKLTDAEALHIIQQHPQVSIEPIVLDPMGYGSIGKDTPLGQEINRLIHDGFLSLRGTYNEDFEPTPKGQNIVGRCYWNSVYGEWDSATFYGFEPKVTKITSKMVDSKTGSAVVQYEISWTTTEYLKKLCQLDTNRLGGMVTQKLSELPTSGEITLKLWDDGWHPQ